MSELLTRFGVESRDDLAETWIREQQPLRRAGDGMRRLFGALTLGLTKPAIAMATSGLALVAGAGVTVAVLASGGGESAPGSLTMATAYVAPTLPPQPAGSIWTPDEALARAQSMAVAKMAERLAKSFDQPVAPAMLALQEAEWLPRVNRYDAPGSEPPNGGRYWAATDGAARNVWHFVVGIGGIPADRIGWFPPSPGRLEFEVLLEDGLDGEPLAFAQRLIVGSGAQFSAGSGFTSPGNEQVFAEQRQRDAEDQQQAVRVAWLNDVAGAASLWLYGQRGPDGRWCVLLQEADGARYTIDAGCIAPGTPLPAPIVPTASTTWEATGARGPVRISVIVDPRITRLDVTVDGRTTSYPTSAGPAPTLSLARFTWIDVGVVAHDLLTAGFDASGQEVARTVVALPGRMPGAATVVRP